MTQKFQPRGIFARMRNIIFSFPTRRVVLLALAFGLQSGAALAENYELNEFRVSTATISDGLVDTWQAGEDMFTNPYFQQGSTDATVTFAPGHITLNGIDYYEQQINLLGAFISHPQFNSREGIRNAETFPLSSPVPGQMVSQILAAQPEIAETNIFLRADSFPHESTGFLVPVGRDLIGVDYETIWTRDGVHGAAVIRIYLYQPEGTGMVFDVEDLDPDGLDVDRPSREGGGGGAGPSPDEGMSFSEDDLKRFTEEQNEDLLKILGCAAGWRPCPYDIDAEAVRIWMDIDENPAELLGEIVAERREAQQQGSE